MARKTHPTLGRMDPNKRRRARMKRTGIDEERLPKEKHVRSGTIELPPGSIPSPSGGKSSAMDFTHALMAGNPVATKAMENALRDPEKETSLADQFVASTYTLGKAMGGTAHHAKQLEPCMRAYREDMKAAHRFVLDDDFVRYATEISSTISSEKLLARLQYATLPYPVTWLEFNLPVKVRTMRRVHQMDDSAFNYDSVGKKLGYLLHRLNDTDAVCQIICQTLDDRDITAAMTSYYFSLADHTFGPREGENIAGTRPMAMEFLPHEWDPSWVEKIGITKEDHTRMMQDARLQEVGNASLWGYTIGGQAGMLERITDLQRLGLPRFLQRHGELGYSRLHLAIRKLLTARKATDSLSGMLAREVTEFAGTMRWVICVLAMLNEVPLSTKHVQPSGLVRVGLTGRRRMLDYHRLTLRLPKTKPLQYIERKFHQATKRRAHEVRAHWRTYVHEVHCKSDDHQWEYDHDNGYRLCGVCNAYGRLIHEHVRGDPNLGWVDKEYVIRKERQT